MFFILFYFQIIFCGQIEFGFESIFWQAERAEGFPEWDYTTISKKKKKKKKKTEKKGGQMPNGQLNYAINSEGGRGKTVKE